MNPKPASIFTFLPALLQDRRKRSDRPELEKALAACKRSKAKLFIAKLDRLSRNLAFIATLMDSGVELKDAGGCSTPSSEGFPRSCQL